MENSSKMQESLLDVKRAFEEVASSSTKEIILDLKENPVFLEIGKALLQIPETEEATKFRLILEMRDYLLKKNIGYLDLDRYLEIMITRNYLIRKKHSVPTYFLTFAFAQAIETLRMFMQQVIKPTIVASKENPELKKKADLEQVITYMFLDAIR